MMTRRKFFKVSAVLGASLLFPRLGYRLNSLGTGWSAPEGVAEAAGTKFVNPLRGVGPAGIPVAVPDGTRTWLAQVADHYTIEIVQFQDQIHPTLGPTTLWGFNPTTALGVSGRCSIY